MPDHPTLIPRLISLLAPHGVLAVQMPYNFDEPTHTLLEEMLTQEPWVSILGPRQRQYFVQTPAWYADTLHALGTAVDLWETIYYHVLNGSDAVLEWVKGTALRPTLSKLITHNSNFLAAYGEKLRAVYPAWTVRNTLPLQAVVLCRATKEGVGILYMRFFFPVR